jgi:CHAT domain-containing protein
MSQAKIETIYSTEYIHFIKTFIINACYMEYCNQIYEKSCLLTAHEIHNDYKTLLESNTTNKEIWEKIFNKNHDLIRYYLHLTTNFQNILNELNIVQYNQTQLANVYVQKTFQEFIDVIEEQKKQYNNTDNKFMVSMKNKNFKDKIIELYQKESYKNTIKNHLIYIIKLHISKQLGKTRFLTDEEKDDIDIMINAVPYFEHLSENGWTIEEINLGTIYHGIDTTPKLYLFRTVELRVLQQINKIF